MSMFKDIEKYSFVKTPLETPQTAPIRKASDTMNQKLKNFQL